MTKDELYQELMALVPQTSVSVNEFRNKLHAVLHEYEDKVEKFFRSEHVDYADSARQTISNEISQIEEFIKSEYCGIHVSLDKIEEFQKKIPFRLRKEKIDTPWYRIRVEENRNGLDYKQMFHFPLTQRNKIKMQRYSFPGYPCLYLGKSIYACWEEMNRPLFNNCMVSMFKNKKELILIDISVPTQKDFNALTQKYVEAFPVIIACMFKVYDFAGSFKPEYIFPQLIMQLVISNLNEFDGILYTTTHYNKEFDYPYEKFINVAIPVKEPLSENSNCPQLANLFTLTEPTCFEFENLKRNIDGPTWEDFGDPRDSQVKNYESSKFSILEECIKQHFNPKEL